MTEVRVGEAYVAKRVYTGSNESGPYEIIVVQNVGRSQPKIAISPTNVPTHIGPNSVFKIEKISSVQHRKWRHPKTGKWYDGSVTVRAKIKALVQLSPQEMEELNYKDVEPEYPTLEDWFNG